MPDLGLYFDGESQLVEELLVAPSVRLYGDEPTVQLSLTFSTTKSGGQPRAVAFVRGRTGSVTSHLCKWLLDTKATFYCLSMFGYAFLTFYF